MPLYQATDGHRRCVPLSPGDTVYTTSWGNVEIEAITHAGAMIHVHIRFATGRSMRTSPRSIGCIWVADKTEEVSFVPIEDDESPPSFEGCTMHVATVTFSLMGVDPEHAASVLHEMLGNISHPNLVRTHFASQPINTGLKSNELS